jgi:hypothetical protein
MLFGPQWLGVASLLALKFVLSVEVVPSIVRLVSDETVCYSIFQRVPNDNFVLHWLIVLKEDKYLP